MNSGTEATSTAVRLAARLHRPRPGRDLPRQLPRRDRRAARGRRQWGGHARAARHRRRAGECGRRDARRPVQRGARARLRRGRACSSNRSPPTWASIAPGARVPRGPARRVRPGRRGAGVRRGDHRLPSRPRRRPGQVRRPARPHDVRQGHRWRAAGRGRRRPARADGDPVAARPGVPRRHAVGQPDRHRRRPGRARPADARHLHRVDGQGPTSGGRVARRLQRRRVRRPVPGRRHAGRDGAAATSPARSTSPAPSARTTAAYGRFFHAMLAQRCRDGARRVRGDLRRRRPHRRRHRRRSPPPPTAPPPKPPKPPNCLRENAPPAI